VDELFNIDDMTLSHTKGWRDTDPDDARDSVIGISSIYNSNNCADLGATDI
jgi:hypothetical protein